MAQLPRVLVMAREFKAQLHAHDSEVINALAQKYLTVDRALEPRIIALAERLAREAAAGITHTKGSLYRMDRWAELQAQMAHELAGYGRFFTPYVEAKRQDMGTLGVRHAEQMLSTAGVASRFDRLPTRAIEQMVAQVSRGPLADLLAEGYGASADALASRLVTGVALGQSPGTMAGEASAALGIGLDRALTIGRTETLRAYREPQLQRMAELGIMQYRRIATFDDLTCLGCLSEDGEIYDSEDGFDAHPNCRCSTVPIVPGVEEEAMPSSEQWFQEQNEETQRDMMGPGRYDLYTSGAVGWSDLSQHTSNETWGGCVTTATVSDLRDIAAPLAQAGQ
jgi:SPP1 gp7 family putative phage head morphogenesis protein